MLPHTRGTTLAASFPTRVLILGLGLLLLLGWGSIGRFIYKGIAPDYVVLAVAVGLLCQTQIGKRQFFVFGFLQRLVFASCPGGHLDSPHAVLLGWGHWRPFGYVSFCNDKSRTQQVGICSKSKVL